jgi:hypothetical protein
MPAVSRVPFERKAVVGNLEATDGFGHFPTSQLAIQLCQGENHRNRHFRFFQLTREFPLLTRYLPTGLIRRIISTDQIDQVESILTRRAAQQAGDIGADIVAMFISELFAQLA